AKRRGLALCFLAEAALFALLALPLSVPVLIIAPLVTGTLAVCCRSVARAEAAVRLARAGRLREGHAGLNMGFELAAAHRAARGDRTALLLICIQTAALLGFMLVIPIEVVNAERDLGAGSSGYGLLLATWGAGIVVGGIVFARARTALTVLAAMASLAVAFAYIGLALAPTLLAACLCSLLGGIGNGVQWVAVMTAVQERVPDAMQVRVVGLLDAGAQLAPGLGFAIGSVLTAVFSARLTYAIAGIATTGAALAFWSLRGKSRSQAMVGSLS